MKIASQTPPPKGELMHLKHSDLVINEGNNCRYEYEIQPLADYIRNNGVPGVVLAYRNSTTGEIHVTDGYRRMRAVSILQAENPEQVYTFPVLVTPQSDTQEQDSLLIQVTANSGKRLTGIEQAELFRRLEATGMSIAEISRKSGLSANYVSQLINLSYSPELVEAVQGKEISVQQAIEALKQSENLTDSDMDLVQIAKDLKPVQKAKNETTSNKANSSPVVKPNADNRNSDMLLRLYTDTGKDILLVLSDLLAGNISYEIAVTELKQSNS